MSKTQETFFKLLFGQNRGYVCIARLNMNDKKDMRERWFEWPAQMKLIEEEVERNGEYYNVYFCPQLFNKKERKRQYVEHTPNAWADLDTCSPEFLDVQPTIIVESSPGRYQGYWVFDPTKPVVPQDAEDLSRRIAYHHKNQGADTSGWDLTQLLRVPETKNLKYDPPVEVQIADIGKRYYRLTDFEKYPELVDYKYSDDPIPDISEIDPIELLEQHRSSLSPKVIKFFMEEPTGDWSSILWNLNMLLFEAGFSADKVLAIANAAQCNKYARDGRPLTSLWKEVQRAKSRFEMAREIMVAEPENVVKLLSTEERELVRNMPETFVERYINWAGTLGDAARQYHQAGAFIALSSVLCGSVYLPTSFGKVNTNLWFMILADTTLTRKTTSMDIAMDLLEEVDNDIVIATDGSVEGLFTALSGRANRPSVFLRDEFSGLLDAMNKKDYMASLAETFTKMYDGKMQKRILKKEIITVTEPRLIIYAGGIRDKVMSLFTDEHVASGFVPRFIFITAETDPAKIKPVGPPTETTTKERSSILKELKSLYNHYGRMKPIRVEGIDETFGMQQPSFSAELTEEAWIRYNELEHHLVTIGLKTDRPHMFTPVGDRLAKSILKAAVLLAASRQRPETGKPVEVTKKDLLKAIAYGETWRTYSQEVVDGIGRTNDERELGAILKWIERNPASSRSKIMRQFKLDVRKARWVFDTLIERGMLRRELTNGTEQFFATTY